MLGKDDRQGTRTQDERTDMTLTSKTRETPATARQKQFWHGKLMGVQEFQRDQQYLLALQRTLLTADDRVRRALWARCGPGR